MAKERDTAGYIYILVNSSMPELVKIGLTRGTTKARANDLSRGTGIPTPFVVAYEELVADCRAVEKKMHDIFATRRESSRREFFRISPKEAIDALQRTSRNFPFMDESEITRINLLPAFDARCRRWLRRDLLGLNYLQTSTMCAIEWEVQESFRLVDTKIDRVALDFIYSEEPTFTPSRTPEENARIFLGLDTYTLIMCFDFIDHEVAEWIDKEYRHEGRVPFSARTPRND